MNSRLKNHLVLAVLSLGSLTVAAVTGPTGAAADRLSIVSAYLCLFLLGLALLIGPANVLRTGRLVTNSYIRRDTGIWAATTGLLHFYLANVLSMNYEYLGVYVENAAEPPTAAVRSSLYSSGTISGYIVAVLFVVLLLLSSDWMVRKVGLKWWKRIQRFSYPAFILTCIHAFEFQVLEARPLLWVIVVAAVTGVTIAAQCTGFVALRKSKQWHSLSLAEARDRKYYGFGGWLITLYILALFLLAWQLFGALNSSGGLVKMFENEENAAIMQVVLIIKALSWLPFLVLAPLRKPLTPAITISFVLATFLLEAITVNFFLGLPASKVIGVNVFNTLIAFSFTAYFLLSKRVNMTYRLRVSA